jgi:hypothetical protein
MLSSMWMNVRDLVCSGILRCRSEMGVVFLYLDESVDLDVASLTGLLVPALQGPRVRDAVIRVARQALISAGQPASGPVELHGVDMLRDVPGVSDEIRLDVFARAIDIVNRERLQIVSVGHSSAGAVRKGYQKIVSDPGDKLYYPNFQELVESLHLLPDMLIVPVFDGVPGRASSGAQAPVNQLAYEAFLLGGAITHWNRISLEDRPAGWVGHREHLRNLMEPVFSDSAQSPLLQLADIIGYLLGVVERVQQAPSTAWKRRLADIARGIDPRLVHRRSVTVHFEGP